MVATGFLTLGSLQSDVINHIEKSKNHVTEIQKSEMVLNTQHRLDNTREKLDAIYALKKLE